MCGASLPPPLYTVFMASYLDKRTTLSVACTYNQKLLAVTPLCNQREPFIKPTAHGSQFNGIQGKSFNPLNPSGNCIYHRHLQSVTLHVVFTDLERF
jgi:hypothetical protein